MAVLPFENLGSPEDDYFADGIADAVRGKLTSLPGIEVIARGSSTPYKKTTKTPQEIARELHAQLPPDGDRALAEERRRQPRAGQPRARRGPGSGAPASKWQQPFDAALTDVFQVQSDIATKVAQALGVALGAGEEKRLSEKPTQNLAAYDAFLKGEEASNSLAADDPPNLRKALGFYEQAVALDPGFAQAWAQRLAGQLAPVLQRAPDPGGGGARPAGGGKGRGARAEPPGGVSGTRHLSATGRSGTARALEQYAKGSALAPGNADLLTGMALAEKASDAGRRRSSTSAGRAPRSPVRATLRRLGECAPQAAALPRGARGLRPRARRSRRPTSI